MRIEHVWSKLLGEGELAAVGARVDGRVAGTLVVPAAAAPALARLLVAERALDAARAVVRLHRGPGDVPAILDALDELDAELAAVARAAPSPEPLPEPSPSPGRRRVGAAHPQREIDRAAALLFYGDPDARAGESVFRAVAVAGVATALDPGGPRHLRYGAFSAVADAAETWPELVAHLREIADTVEAQAEAHAEAAGIERGPAADRRGAGS